jgi:hypothetical protein
MIIKSIIPASISFRTKFFAFVGNFLSNSSFLGTFTKFLDIFAPLLANRNFFPRKAKMLHNTLKRMNLIEKYSQKQKNLFVTHKRKW